MMKCPLCRSRYPADPALEGKRVRCPRCGHVWRDQRGDLRRVVGALGEAAENWAELGSTTLAAVDHASTVGGLVARQLAKRETFPATKWVGHHIGRYQLLAVLGQGAMGHVYEGYDAELDRKAALKLLPRVRAVDEAATIGERMFLQEARIAAALQHPNVVTIYEVGEAGGIWYYAMELVHGTTLLELVRRGGPLPVNQACYVIANAARALAEAHRRRIVHRDVKPDNIMIDTEGRVKVTDFGLADVGDGGGVAPGQISLGTPGWISPEVARQERATKESDLYGLGLTLYFALTGDRLIKGTSKSSMIAQQRSAKELDRAQLPEAWPERLRDALVQCLHVNPAHRYHDGDLLAMDLTRAMRPDAADMTVTLDLGPMTPGARRIAPAWVSWLALTALAATSALLAAWFFQVR